MSSAIDETIKEIAVKHGVSLGHDDPLLIFQTMNERLLEQHRTVQQELLSGFKEEIQQISSKWQYDAKDKAEKILNSALCASKDSLDSILINAANEHTNLIKSELDKSIAEIRQLNGEAKAISRFGFYSLIGVLMTACVFAVLFF